MVPGLPRKALPYDQSISSKTDLGNGIPEDIRKMPFLREDSPKNQERYILERNINIDYPKENDHA